MTDEEIETITIKEMFDICKKYGIIIELSSLSGSYNPYNYMIKLIYGEKLHYDLIDSSRMEFILADRESFEKYIFYILEKLKGKEVTE